LLLFYFEFAQLRGILFTGLIDLAIHRNSLIGGDDFKSGQTKMKSVLVDFLVGAGIKVPHNSLPKGYKILGILKYILWTFGGSQHQ